MAVYNMRHSGYPKDAVNIMRGTKWGNPFVIGVHGSRGEVLHKYLEKVRNDPEFIAEVKRELFGKDLVCCCKPLACHGDILHAIANGEPK